jgi:hypothetical protein
MRRAVIQEHGAWLEARYAEGRVRFAGRCYDGPFGLVVLDATASRTHGRSWKQTRLFVAASRPPSCTPSGRSSHISASPKAETLAGVGPACLLARAGWRCG